MQQIGKIVVPEIDSSELFRSFCLDEVIIDQNWILGRSGKGLHGNAFTAPESGQAVRVDLAGAFPVEQVDSYCVVVGRLGLDVVFFYPAILHVPQEDGGNIAIEEGIAFQNNFFGIPVVQAAPIDTVASVLENVVFKGKFLYEKVVDTGWLCLFRWR